MKIFPIEFKPGVPVYEQVLYAARKAIVSGELKAGDEFPSVRALSAEYKLTPNTIQKAMVALKNEGLIETIPGIGNRVAALPESTEKQRDRVLDDQLEALVLRAKQHHLTLAEVTKALTNHWKNL